MSQHPNEERGYPDPKAADPSSPWLTILIFVVPIVVFLLLVLRLGKKQYGRVDRAMELAEAQLAAQQQTNHLLQRLIEV